MKPKLTIDELIAKVMAELERLKYSKISYCKYRCFYKKFSAFAKENKEVYFSEELGRRFLKEKYNCIINNYTEAIPKRYRDLIRKIRVLGDYQLHNVIFRKIIKKPGFIKPPQFEKELAAYERECESKDYSKRGLPIADAAFVFFYRLS